MHYLENYFSKVKHIFNKYGTKKERDEFHRTKMVENLLGFHSQNEGQEGGYKHAIQEMIAQ